MCRLDASNKQLQMIAALARRRHTPSVSKRSDYHLYAFCVTGVKKFPHFEVLICTIYAITILYYFMQAKSRFACGQKNV